MTVRSIRILVEFQFPSKTWRLWDGAGPFMDADGNIWAGVGLLEGLDEIESAMNAEASLLEMYLNGVDPEVADMAYEDLNAGEVIDTKVRLLIQDCDEYDQPVGDPQVRFTGRIDNLRIDDVADEEQVLSRVTVEITNRFVLRTLTSGAVLSDVDQKARSAILNPSAPPDRFAERIHVYLDASIRWPHYTS